MPQDSGSESEKDKALSSAAARLLEQVQSEPVPDSILELAQELDRNLRARRKRVAPRD